MRTFVGLLFVGLLTIASCTADCPLSKDQQSKILSDAVGLSAQTNNQKTNQQNLIYNYQFEEAFSSVPAIAIGMNEIAASESPVLDIRVSSPKVNQKGIYFQAKSGEKSKWKNFKVNFVATTRDDLELGTATVTTPGLTRQNTFDLVYPTKKEFSPNGLKVKSFLQGFDIESQDGKHLSIKQQNQYVSNHQLYFTFSSAQRSSIIRYLTISIILYDIYTPGVLYADGIIDQNFVVSKTDITIPKHGINELRTYMVGINSFDTSAVEPISISTAIDETFTLVIGPIDRFEIDFISVSYLILSVVDCGSCSGYPLLFDGICQPSCPPNTVPRGPICIPTNCPSGYIRDQAGECILDCKQNQVYDYDSSRCICTEGFYLIGGVCDQCPSDSYYNYRTQSCESLCGPNSYYNTTDRLCYCDQGFYVINNQCQKCPYGSKYDFNTQDCVDICKANEVYSPEGCVCQNGYYRIRGICQRCPYGLVYNARLQDCGCPAGTQLVGYQCLPACKANEIRIGNQCFCKDGYELIDGECDICSEYSYYNAAYGRCDCIYGYTRIKGQCVKICPPNEYLDVKTQTCLSRCEKYGEIYVKGECICAPDFERDPYGDCILKCGDLKYRDENGDCQCYPGYWKNPYGECRYINCPAGTEWDPIREDCINSCGAFQIYINGGCVCKWGFLKDNVYGKCLPECNTNQVRVNGFCFCKDGYKDVGGGFCLLQCPPGTIDYYGECVQNRGGGSYSCPYGQVYDHILGKCVCKAPKAWIWGQCVDVPINPCMQNEYWTGAKCVCESGYFRVHGKCEIVKYPHDRQCPPNSEFNGVNCQCLYSFYPIKPGYCDKCPHGKVWNGKFCAKKEEDCHHGYKWDHYKDCCVPIHAFCKQGEQWNGMKCVCKQGYFWINSQCQTCPPNTVFDGFKCSQGYGPKCGWNQFWNGSRCVCIPGTYPLSKKKCVQCPEYTQWDGTCCKVKSGHNVPWTVY